VLSVRDDLMVIEVDGATVDRQAGDVEIAEVFVLQI
jgi:hypothetical protein